MVRKAEDYHHISYVTHLAIHHIPMQSCMARLQAHVTGIPADNMDLPASPIESHSGRAGAFSYGPQRSSFWHAPSMTNPAEHQTFSGGHIIPGEPAAATYASNASPLASPLQDGPTMFATHSLPAPLPSPPHSHSQAAHDASEPPGTGRRMQRAGSASQGEPRRRLIQRRSSTALGQLQSAIGSVFRSSHRHGRRSSSSNQSSPPSGGPQQEAHAHRAWGTSGAIVPVEHGWGDPFGEPYTAIDQDPHAASWADAFSDSSAAEFSPTTSDRPLLADEHSHIENPFGRADFPPSAAGYSDSMTDYPTRLVDHPQLAVGYQLPTASHPLTEGVMHTSWHELGSLDGSGYSQPQHLSHGQTPASATAGGHGLARALSVSSRATFHPAWFSPSRTETRPGPIIGATSAASAEHPALEWDPPHSFMPGLRTASHQSAAAASPHPPSHVRPADLLQQEQAMDWGLPPEHTWSDALLDAHAPGQQQLPQQLPPEVSWSDALLEAQSHGQRQLSRQLSDPWPQQPHPGHATTSPITVSPLGHGAQAQVGNSAASAMGGWQWGMHGGTTEGAGMEDPSRELLVVEDDGTAVWHDAHEVPADPWSPTAART